ncbi:MAG: hypothetical protein ACI4B3_01125 [Prevotella sp.]
MIKKQIVRLAFFVSLLFSVFTSVKAQNTTSSVVGTTSDGEELLIGAVVRLANYKDADGNVRLVDQTFDVTRNSTDCWRMQIGVKYIFN